MTASSMATKLVILGALLFLVSPGCATLQDVERIEEEGYYRREHSLAQPYHGRPILGGVFLKQLECVTVCVTGNGMDVPFWTFGGNTVISSNYVRLTPDRQSKKGFLWNTYVSNSL